jgi:hypothetical protein
MKVQLTKKLAERIDGVDLTGRSVGDVMDLPVDEARILVAEHWAQPTDSVVSETAEDRLTRKRHSPRR